MKSVKKEPTMRKFVFFLIVVILSVSVQAADKPAAAKTIPALLVIDTQNAFLPYMDEQDKKMGLMMVNYYIALFRANGFPVIRVYHSDPQGGPKTGTEPFEFAKEIAVTKDDAMVVKNFPNAFKKTDLDKILKEKGCNTIFLCGLSAVGCVLETYFGGSNLDYEVFMLKDGLISHDHSLTRAVQEICKTIDYYALELLLKNVVK
jgi:nicotinamidase-related amidase